MELKLHTIYGQLTAVFESTPISVIKDVWVAWFKEKPSVIVQGDSISDCIGELHISLDALQRYENRQKEELLRK